MRKLSIIAILAVFVSQSAVASEILYEMFLNSSDGVIQFSGDYIGGQFGASIATGDFDGDGVIDTAIGAPFSSTDEKKWNGSVSIYMENGEKELTISGRASGDQLGSKVMFGDFNGDGFDDLAISAYNAYYMGKRPGQVYIYYGNKYWNSQADNLVDSQSYDISYFKPNLELSGYATKEGFGMDIGVSDLNGDDVDDLLVGVPFSSSLSSINSGKVNAYFGYEHGLKKEISLVFRGNVDEERFGSSIATGDIDGDSSENVIIGAYYSNVDDVEQAGRVYVYEDYEEGDYVIRTPLLTLSGFEESGWFGFDVASGMFSDDLIDDIAISSFPFNGDRGGAKLSIFYGDEESMMQEPNLVYQDPIEDSIQGASLLMADFDLDNRDDIVVGAPGVGGKVSASPGNVHIYYANGKKAIIVGKDNDDWFGSSLASSDYNMDGYRDLIVGARYADGEDSVNNGEVYVLPGNGIVFGNPRIASTETYVRRDEFIGEILDRLELREKHVTDLSECEKFKEFCLFNFIAMSDYSEMNLEGPMQLYPDITPDVRFYNDINIATMLGIVNGYLNEENSPFHPERPISRVHSLKVIFGSLDLVKPVFRFELENIDTQSSYFSDVDPRIAHMWWYPRYINFAVEQGIVSSLDLFRPDDNITMAELDELIEQTLSYLDRINEEANTRGNTGDETFGFGSESEG